MLLSSSSSSLFVSFDFLGNGTRKNYVECEMELLIMSHSIPFGVADFNYLFFRWFICCLVSSHRVFHTIQMQSFHRFWPTRHWWILNNRRRRNTKLWAPVINPLFVSAHTLLLARVLSSSSCLIYVVTMNFLHKCVAWRRNLTPNHSIYCPATQETG